MTRPGLTDAVRMRSQRCPSCRHELTAATMFDPTGASLEIQPEKDDVTMCIYCGQLLQYNANMTVRLADMLDLPELKDWYRWREDVAAAR